MRRAIVTAVAVAAVAAGVAYGLTRPAGAGSSGRVRAGQPAPDLTGIDLGGQRVSLTGERGHTVLVNFWASWCVPCRDDFPILARALAAHPNLSVLGVVERDTAGAARAFARQLRASWPSLYDGAGPDNGPAARAFGLRAVLPVTVVVGPDGVVRGTRFGQLSQADVDRLLAAVP